MNSELKNLKESVLSLISKLSEDDIRLKLLVIENILSDYDYLDDQKLIKNPDPVELLISHLEQSYFEVNSERLHSEWLIVLALYWLNKMEKAQLYGNPPGK